jgi:hypothetical protein
MISVGPPPPYANVEPLLQQYYSQCIQSLLTNFERSLDEGLGILEPVADGTQYGTEFDIDDLIWMDTATKTKAAADSISSGAMSPDEARRKYFGLGPVAGGDTPYMQQQMFGLEALAQRDANDPFANQSRAPTATPAAGTAPPGRGRGRAPSARESAEGRLRTSSPPSSRNAPSRDFVTQAVADLALHQTATNTHLRAGPTP